MPHLWPTGSSWGRPLDYGPVLLRKPFGPHLAMGALSSAVPSWRLQVHLGCVRLSPACPSRRLHTCHLRPARHYPRLWIRPPSPGGRRDFNPPDQRAAWRTIRPLLTSAPRSGTLARPSVPRDTMQISRGKLDRLRRTPAESTAWTCGGYGTSRNRARSSSPDCLIFGFCPSGRGFASTLPSDGASRRPPLRLASPLSPPDLGRGLAPPSCQACPAHPWHGKRARCVRQRLNRRRVRVYHTTWTAQTPPTQSTGIIVLEALVHDIRRFFGGQFSVSPGGQFWMSLDTRDRRPASRWRPR